MRKEEIIIGSELISCCKTEGCGNPLVVGGFYEMNLRNKINKGLFLEDFQIPNHVLGAHVMLLHTIQPKEKVLRPGAGFE